MYLIIGCFNWIGYHLMDKLLVNGNKVVGVDQLNHTKKEQMALTVGRNANFSYYETTDQVNQNEQFEKFRTVFVFDALRTFYFIPNQNNDNKILVDYPLLYGEWMEQSETGFYFDDVFISFKSTFFYERAVYIDDFILTIMQVIDASIFPERITFYAAQQAKKQTLQQNEMAILTSLPHERRLEYLKEHYQKYSKFY